MCDFVGKSPEEAIINAHRSIIITDNSIKFYNILIPKDENNLINDIWKLTPLGTQCAFYPSFMWKEGKLVCGDICHTLYGVSYDPKLCCGKEDDAFYIGTHFIDLYRDYLLLE